MKIKLNLFLNLRQVNAFNTPKEREKRRRRRWINLRGKYIQKEICFFSTSFHVRRMLPTERHWDTQSSVINATRRQFSFSFTAPCVFVLCCVVYMENSYHKICFDSIPFEGEADERRREEKWQSNIRLHLQHDVYLLVWWQHNEQRQFSFFSGFLWTNTTCCCLSLFLYVLRIILNSWWCL